MLFGLSLHVSSKKIFFWKFIKSNLCFIPLKFFFTISQLIYQFTFWIFLIFCEFAVESTFNPESTGNKHCISYQKDLFIINIMIIICFNNTQQVFNVWFSTLCITRICLLYAFVIDICFLWQKTFCEMHK